MSCQHVCSSDFTVFEKVEKERRDIRAVTKYVLVSYSSDEFSTAVHLLTHSLIFQFPDLDNSLLFFLVCTIQITPPTQIQETRMCQKQKKTQIRNNTHVSSGQNPNNSNSKDPFSSATDLWHLMCSSSLHLPLLSLTFLRSYGRIALGKLGAASSYQGSTNCYSPSQKDDVVFNQQMSPFEVSRWKMIRKCKVFFKNTGNTFYK